MAMLSRVADSLFWMGRYLERSEQLARQLGVTRDILVDLAEPDPTGAKAEWQATLASLSVPDRSLEQLVFDATEPGSLASCVSQARENARQIREIITNEMWERINQAYWNLIETLDESPNETELTAALADTLLATAALDGLTDASMVRGDAWIFLKLGKSIERLDRIGRCIVARLQQAAQTPSSTQKNVVSVTMLRSLGVLEAYRKISPTKVGRRTVLSFLLFQPNLPRSLRYCALESATLVGQIPHLGDGADAAVTRAFGRLASQLQHGDVDEVIDNGPEIFLRDALGCASRASSLLQRSFSLS
jgi:uncharacterized alpha-E superfamily protein